MGERQSKPDYDTTSNNSENIFRALESGDSTMIFEMVQSGSLSPEQPLGSDHLTLLHLLCQLGNLDLLKDIASTHPESIVHTVLSQYSLLHCACKHGQICIVQYLIDNGLYDEMVLTVDGDSSPLHLAVEGGHLRIVAYLLEQTVCHPMLVDKNGNTLIHTACLRGQIGIVEYLAETGKYDPNVVNCYTQQTPLHAAAKNGYLNIVQYLVEEEKSTLSCVDDVGRTPLYLAVWNGRLKIVQYLAAKSEGELLTITTGEDMLDDGTPVAAGKTPLLAACLRGHFDIVQYLVEECHCSVTCSDVIGNIPLHCASAGGIMKIVRYLIEECKCDPMSRRCDDQYQLAPLHLSASYGHLPITKYLIKERDCNPMCCTKTGSAPLHLASQEGHYDTVKYLIEECKCDPTSLQCDEQFQWAPLHFAARNGHLPITKYLIEEHGCDPMCRAKTGSAPLHLASEKGHYDTVKYLIEECKCDPMSRGCDDKSVPLHLSVSKGHLPITKYLIKEHSCDPMCYTHKGEALIHLASEEGHFDTVKYLIEECTCDPMSKARRCDESVPLHFSASKGHLPITKYLIEEHGCGPICCTRKGEALIHLASEEGHFDTVKYLIEECNCDPMSRRCDELVPLHLSASKGHLTITKYLIKEHSCDPMCSTQQGAALIHLASKEGHFDTVKYLIEACKCDPMCIDANQWVSLHYATVYGHLPIIKYLIEEHGCDPTCSTNTGSAPLHLASHKGHYDTVKYLIEECKCNPMCSDGDDANPWVPLHFATSNGHLPITKYLIEKHACDPMCHTKAGSAPLHLASQEGHYDTVKYLIEECQCDPMSKTQYQPTPLHFSASKGYIPITKYFTEEHSCDPMCYTKEGVTPLHLASEEGHFDIVKYLIEKCNCDPMCSDANLWISLHFATINGHLPIIKYLIEEHGCDPTCCTNTGSAPLHLASQEGHYDTVKYLIEECQCDPMSRTQYYLVPLHFTVINGHLPITKYLIEEHGCDPLCRTEKGEGLIHLASEEGHFDTVKYLIEECKCDPMSSRCDESVPLHISTSKGHLAITKYLIEECKCDPMSLQCDEQFQWAPLHSAASNGHLTITKYLIEEHGCDPMCCTKKGAAPLHLASENGHFDTVKYLIEECKCDPMSRGCDEHYQLAPLHLSASKGHLPITKYLIEEHGCDPICRTEKGEALIHLASEEGHFDTVKYLIEECNCDPMSSRCDESVPLHISTSKGHLAITKYLIEECKCDPMSLQCDEQFQWAPLHSAASNGHLTITKYLIEEHGCDPMCCTKKGAAPLHLASENGHFDTVKYLIEECKCDPMSVRMCQTKGGKDPLHLAAEKGHFDIVQYLIERQGCDPMCQKKLVRTALHYAVEKKHVILVDYLLMKGANPTIVASSFLHFTEGHYPFLSCYNTDFPLVGTKVFVLGNQGVGKSSLVESLKQEEKWFRGRFTNVQVSPNTAGIISHLYMSQNFGDVMLYDFAGHSVYYASHSVLIQNGTGSSHVLVFVLVLDLRLPTGDFTSQLEYWVSFLMCTCSARMSLVIAGSHNDHAMSSIDFQAKKAVITKFMETMNEARLNVSFVPLDCRKAKSTGIDEIRRIICQLSKGMNGKGMISTFHYMLLAFFRWSFGNTIAFQLSEAIERLWCTSGVPFPSVDEEYIYTLCEDLCAVSCILFLKNKTPLKSWIALDQSKVLNEIQRFKQNDDFISTMKHITTGIVPHSLLVNNFATLNEVTLEFVLKYMVEMEYCQLVDGGVLGKPMLDEPYYFFPDQVLGESATHVWTSDEKYKRYFGWLLKCKHDFFFPRFVQVLLLRLATQKELVGAQDHISASSLSQLRPGTKIWKNGVSWIDESCEVVVEIIENSTGILVMTRCWNDYEVSHCRVRSAVIKTILKVKEDTCPQLETEEFIINPKQTNQYPPPHTSSLQLVNICELPDRCSESDVVILYSMHDSGLYTQMAVADLIGFDPFLMVSKAGLNILFNRQDHVMSSDTLRDIADDLSEHWEPMCKVLGLQSKEFQRKLKDNPPDPTDKCLSTITEACIVSTGGPVTNKWLREKLEKYSIVGENNLHNMLGGASAVSTVETENQHEVTPPKEEDAASLNSDTHLELSSEYFTTNDLKFLTEALCSVAADWQNLGIQLGVPPSELTDIRTNLSLIVYGSKAYFREMLTAWLRMASPSAGQLSALVAALRSEAVGQRVLSAKLEERGVAYLKQREDE